jgi:hypothetical protein
MTTPDPIASFTVGASQLPLPNDQTTLTWQTTGIDSCELSWLQTTTTVTYDGQPVPNNTPGNVPVQVTGDAPVNVTVLVDDTFTLAATGGGVTYQKQQAVHLVPKFSAVTNPPVITGVSPASGDLAGGGQVTIVGSGFLGTTAVHFGTVAATVVSAELDTQVIVTVPAGTQAGAVDITVTTLTGTSAVTPMDRFAYTAPGLPVVTDVSPATGNPAGGDTVTISGSGFGAVLSEVTVSFGGAAATVTAATDSQLTVTTPLTPITGVSGTGLVDVTVTTAAGPSAATAADWFTYTLPGFPLVMAVTPVSGVAGGDPSGGDLVTISGTGLAAATGVTFGSAPGVVTDISDTQLVVITPLGAEDSTVDVVVQTSAGASPVVPASQFTYAAVPKDVLPNQLFRLIWSCPAGSRPYLTWAVSTGGAVSVAIAGQAINEGDYLSTDSGWATATITAQTTFTLQLTYGTSPAGSRQISVQPLTFGGFTVSEHLIDVQDGAQSVLLTWNAVNAAELSLTFSAATIAPVTITLPPRSTSYLTQLPPPSYPNGPITYALTAGGADQNGNYLTETESCPVTPYPVSVTGFSAALSAPETSGQQAIRVSWQAANATSVVLLVGTTLRYPGIHDTSAFVPLPLPPHPPSPAPTTAFVYAVSLSAQGYVQPGVPNTGWAVVAPQPVQLSTFEARLEVNSVALEWSASAATWLVVSDGQTSQGYFGGTTVASWPRPADDRLYTLTAYGYPTGAPWPTLSARVKVLKEGKESVHKEALLEKNALERPKSPLERPKAVLLDLANAGPELLEGTQQAFITPEERPDVGAQLRDPGPAS